jgi:hypothetical protein
LTQSHRENCDAVVSERQRLEVLHVKQACNVGTCAAPCCQGWHMCSAMLSTLALVQRHVVNVGTCAALCCQLWHMPRHVVNVATCAAPLSRNNLEILCNCFAAYCCCRWC